MNDDGLPPLREIVPPPFDGTGSLYAPAGRACPSCGGGLFRGPVPCPDGYPGCCVNHIGLRCQQCGRSYQ